LASEPRRRCGLRPVLGRDVRSPISAGWPRQAATTANSMATMGRPSSTGQGEALPRAAGLNVQDHNSCLRNKRTVPSQGKDGRVPSPSPAGSGSSRRRWDSPPTGTSADHPLADRRLGPAHPAFPGPCGARYSTSPAHPHYSGGLRTGARPPPTCPPPEGLSASGGLVSVGQAGASALMRGRP